MKDDGVINKSGNVVDESVVGSCRADFQGELVRPGNPVISSCAGVLSIRENP